MKLDETLVIRCSKPLKRAIGKWAEQNHVKATEMARVVLERAFGIEDEGVQLPPGIGNFKSPVQGAPGQK